FLKAFHEVWYGIMTDIIFFQYGDGRFPEIANLHGSFSSQNFSSDVIPVNTASAEIYGANLAILKSQVCYRIIHIINRLHFRISKHICDTVQFRYFTHKPASQIEVMDSHIKKKASTHRRIGILQTWTIRIAGGRFE